MAIGLAASAIGSLAACGNDVVIHPGGSGGSGASTATTSGPTTSTPTPSTTTTWTTYTTTGEGGAGAAVPSLCAEFCNLAEPCGYDPSCESECTSASTPDCLTVYTAFLNCLVSGFDPDTCELPPQCQAVMNQWAMCEGEPPPPPPPPCGPQGCGVGSDGSCDCTMTCATVTYETSCVQENGASYCRCAIDGQSVGDCTGGGPMPCDVQEGCCASYFFWDEY